MQDEAVRSRIQMVGLTLCFDGIWVKRRPLKDGRRSKEPVNFRLIISKGETEHRAEANH